MADCTIHLDNYTGVYYTGSEIKGRIECYFDQNTRVRGINIKWACRESSKFTNMESYTNPANGLRETRYKLVKSKGHSGIFFTTEQKLLDSAGPQVLKGRHVYPFSFTLDNNNPSSVNHAYACIYYEMKAVIDIPMGIDYEDELIFIVQSLIDFNKMPKELQQEATYSKEKTICCWCCGNGDITMDVELSKKAFVPGEVVGLKVFICNMSNINVDGLTVTFTKATSVSHRDKNVDTIASFKKQGVGAHSEHTFDLPFAIPESLVVLNYAERSIYFTVRYLLLVHCEIFGALTGLTIPIKDIKIGHIKWNDRVEHEENGQNSASPFDSTGLPSYSTSTSEKPGHPAGQSAVPLLASAPGEHNS